MVEPLGLLWPVEQLARAGRGGEVGELVFFALRNGGGATRGRKRKAVATDAAGTRSMRDFVALGTRVA